MIKTLAEQALEVAFFYDGVRESRPNRGEYVDMFIKSVGIDPDEFEAQNGKGPAWCACYVYHCHKRAAELLQVPNPAPKTASVHKLFAYARAHGLTVKEPRAGDVFGIDHGLGRGHVGFVVDATGDSVHTIEGNTNEAGSREGDGVRQRRRPLHTLTLGFARFTTPGEPA